MEQHTGSKLWREYKAVYRHPAFLASMQSIHVKCSARWSQTGIKIARRNINNLRYADNTTLIAETEEELKSFLMNLKEESEKSWLKTQHSETKLRHLFPSLHGK